MLCTTLEQTLSLAQSLASGRRHGKVTIEHLLLALTYDSDAAALLKSAGAELEALQDELTQFLDKDLSVLVTDKPDAPERTEGFQRVAWRAQLLQAPGNDTTGADALLSLCCELASHAVYFLRKQDLVRVDALKLLVQAKPDVRG